MAETVSAAAAAAAAAVGPSRVATTTMHQVHQAPHTCIFGKYYYIHTV